MEIAAWTKEISTATLERKLIAFYRTEDVMGIRVSLNREDEMVKSIPIDCM